MRMTDIVLHLDYFTSRRANCTISTIILNLHQKVDGFNAANYLGTLNIKLSSS